jgi:hypothetical protein
MENRKEKASNQRSTQQRIHWKSFIDLCGPTRTQSIQGENYFMFLIDDYSRRTWVTFLKEKYESFEKFK